MKGMIRMTEVPMCQSCGLPFNEEHAHFIAKEQDGCASIYCTNCYKDGKFIDPNMSMKEMVELIVPVLGKVIGEEEARKEMTTLLPTLKRWRQ
ncbi:zinc ribbon domain-containing protein [Clostridium sp. YIM B02500]|uniref:zinc ribbon domain-containing protein n=1 Tax=Clostridium sp. YIM B02500 TaxID=2910681 RepID=UPI001EEF1F55|nr:zinc ribbon domain-containing protein [Clostridium sp. YIM B02500]